MSVLAEQNYITPEEYLATERTAFEKHEYFNGEVFQMAGASLRHVLIVDNVAFTLRLELRDGSCTVFTTDLRVHVPTTGLFTYPDVSVVCGEPELADDHQDILLNPVLIIEVLSPSTQNYDQGAKFAHYRTIEALKEYVLVWQDKKRVARYTKRDDASWILTDFIGENAEIELSSVNCTIRMSDIYEKVGLEI